MDMMLEQFKTIFDRPEKVKKLRETILDLAVRGRLVPQDPNDEPTSVLIERIREEKERLIKEKKIKKEKSLPEISEEEKPFELPNGWEWIRLKEIGYNLGQKKPDTIFTYIDVGSINKENGEIEEELTVLEPENAPSRARKLVDKGTVIYSTVRPYLLNIAIIDKEFEFEPIVSTAFAVIHPCNGMNNRFILYYLRSIPFVKYVESQMVGMAYPAINDEKLFLGLFPMPPSEEQKRIVEKVDLLMAFCDELEKSLEKKVHYGELTAKSAFNAVGNVSTAEELEKTLRFILLNFKDLSLGDNAVKELKNCILQLAVQGKLVPQDPNDEPAEVLLAKIREEKESLIKEKKIKKEKPLSEISEEEKPFELPSGWKWTRMNNIIDVRDGTHDSPKYILDGGYPLVTGKDFYGGTLNFKKTKYISKEDYEKIISRSKVDKGDILYSMIGGNIGSMVLIDRELEIAIKNVALFKKYIDGVYETRYLMAYLQATVDDMKSNAKGGAQPFVSLTILRNYTFPLPPFEEQKRIVEKVDSLMTLCNELEKKIQKQRDYSNRLMESILKSSF